MSSRFNHLNVPSQWQHYWSKYPEGYTILEALLNWVKQVDDMVDNVNNWNKYLDEFVEQFDTDLQGTVEGILEEWQLDGTLALVIDQALQTQIDYAVRDVTVENLQTAIDEHATLGTKLTLRRKTFEITSTLTIPSNIEIDWNNSTVKRKTGSGVYDLLLNSDIVNGNTNIKMYNLTIDGNKDIDELVNTNDAHRFSGLRLKNSTDIYLENVTVRKTVNGEDQQTTPASGIFLQGCTDFLFHNVNGFDNDGTAIFFRDSEGVIDGSLTKNNKGSGISSNNAPRTHYLNCRSFNNSYSNISVNGVDSIVDNILTAGSLYSGLNIGHNGFPSDRTQVTNVISYNNTFEGVTIAGSKDVQLTNIDVYGNKRHNIQIFDGSSNISLDNVNSHESAGGYGVWFRTGTGHRLNNSKINKNWITGIMCDTGTSGAIGDTVEANSNGQGVATNNAGITLNNCTGWKIGSATCTDGQGVKTQESGIWIAGGGSHIIDNPVLTGNKTNLIRLTSSPTNMKIRREPSLLETMSNLNAWVTNGYYHRDQDAWVRGSLTTAGGTADTSCFQLPIGYRPLRQIVVTGYDTETNAPTKIIITTGGDIRPQTSIKPQDISFVFPTATSPLDQTLYMG